MNDEINNIINGSSETGSEGDGEKEVVEEASQPLNTEDFSAESETDSVCGGPEKEEPTAGESTGGSTYETKPPVTDGEYHYTGDRIINGDASGHSNPYRRDPRPGTENRYPYGDAQSSTGENASSEQQNRNPYSTGYRQQYSDQYAQRQQPSYGERYENPGAPNNPYGRSAYPYDGQNRPYAYPEQGGGSVKKKNGGKVIIALLCAVLLVVLGVVVGVTVKGVRHTVAPGNNNEVTEERIDNVDEAVTAISPVADTSAGADGVLPPTQIYKNVLPSSVGILVYSNGSKSVASEGSGVIISEDNDGKYTYILTCAHVISGAGLNIMVQLFNEKEYKAQVVGYDSRTDIGVVRIEASGLKKLEIGDSNSLSVGETVYAIGNPGGTEFSNTKTNGKITAIARPQNSSTTGYTMECIQHNAAINPGNSGGALVNQYGQLIGINSMKIISAEYEGMGFAVPSSVFVDVMNDIVVNGYVRNRPKIGISYVRASNEQAYAMFVAIKGLPSGSIVVAEISEDSDFYDKLQVGDLVTAINGEKLDSSADLAAKIEDMKVGDEITLDVVRINRDYSFKEFTFSGVLVEDRETVPEEEEEETSTSLFDDYFGDSRDSSENPYSDFFDDFFGDFFGNP